MAEFEIIAINYEQRRIEYFKQQKAAAERKLKYWMSRKKHVSNSHEWLPIEEKCSDCGDLINFYTNAIAVFERSLGNEEQRNLAEKLREHAEWAHVNEWETPITLGDDLEAAANMIEQLEATAEASSAQVAMCDVTMERCDQRNPHAMKTSEEIKKGLECCSRSDSCPQECPYYDVQSCGSVSKLDALAYIQQLEAQLPRWISVDDPPKNGGRYLIMFEDGHCCDAEYDEDIDFDSQFGEWVSIYHPETLGYLDSEWRGYQEVTHWMTLPESPKEV